MFKKFINKRRITNRKIEKFIHSITFFGFDVMLFVTHPNEKRACVAMVGTGAPVENEDDIYLMVYRLCKKIEDEFSDKSINVKFQITRANSEANNE